MLAATHEKTIELLRNLRLKIEERTALRPRNRAALFLIAFHN